MKMWIRFSGILGLVIFLFGVVGGVLISSFAQPLIFLHLVGGGVLLLVWFLLSGIGNLGRTGQTVRSRTVRFGFFAFSSTILFGLVLVGLNYIVSRHDKRWDLTEEGVYSLADQSIKVVQALKKPLKIVIMDVDGAPGGGRGKELLDLYAYHNSKSIKAELLDPRSKPHLVDTYGMKEGNLVYFEYGEGDKKGVSRINEISEEAITNAIIKLTRGEAKKIYFVQGHDEPRLDDNGPSGIKSLADAIADEHLSTDEIILAKSAQIPEDAAAVILASPKKPLLPEEREVLVKYAQSGGRLLMLTDPRTTSDVAEISKSFQIEVNDDVIIDQIQRLFAAPALGAQPIVTTYAAHPITRGLTRQDLTVYNVASSVRSIGKTDPETTYTDLLKSSPTAWGEKNLAQIFDSPEPVAVLENDDSAGPVSLAIAYEHKLPADKSESENLKETQNKADGTTTIDVPVDNENTPKFNKTSRVLVFGDSDWLLNANLQVYSNRDLILNSINWLVGEEGGVSIRPKAIRASMAPIPRDTFMLLLASSFIVPELILILGLVIWWRRRALSA